MQIDVDERQNVPKYPISGFWNLCIASELLSGAIKQKTRSTDLYVRDYLIPSR
jgi:hypothetical protein